MRTMITLLYFVCSFFAFGAGVDSVKNDPPGFGFIGWLIFSGTILIVIWHG